MSACLPLIPSSIEAHAALQALCDVRDSLSTPCPTSCAGDGQPGTAEAFFAMRNEQPVILLYRANGMPDVCILGRRHFAVWEDPFLKPCYLFALVAGNLALKEDSFTTRSGRPITLRIYAEAKDVDKVGHAMKSLQKAMKWDEDVFGAP